MRLGSDPGLAVLQPSMQRTQASATPIDKQEKHSAGLAEPVAPQHLPPRLIVTLLAGQIELTAPLEKVVFARPEPRLRPSGYADLRPHAARLFRNKATQRQQFLTFIGQSRQLLMFGATDINAAFQIQQRLCFLVETRKAGGYSDHAVLTMTTHTGSGALFFFIVLSSRSNPQIAGIGKSIVLQRPSLRRKKVIARNRLLV